MKKTPILAAAVLAASLFIISCKNSGTTGLPIPRDAAFVLHINAPSLTKKLSWKEIQETEWFRDMYAKAKEHKDSLQQKVMDNPENSGIDIKSDFAFFLRKQGSAGLMVFEGHLKNPADFETMIKKADSSLEIKQDGDLHYAHKAGNSLLSWNNTRFFFMTALGSFSAPANSEDNKLASDSLRKFTKELLALESSNSIESDEHFTSLIKEPGDLHYWMNMEQYFSTMGPAMMNNPVTSMITNMNNFFRGSISTGTLNFDEGRITVKSRQYVGEEMAKVLNKYDFKPVSKDLVNRIPSQNVVGAMVANYPPAATKDMFRAMGIDGFANTFLGKLNFTLDELVDATKGQIVLAATDFSQTTQQKFMPGTNYSYPSTQTDVKVLLGLSVNNKASFDKLVAVAQDQIGDSAQRAALLSRINFKTTNDWFAISNSAESVDKFIAGGKSDLPFAERISGHPFGLYIDIQKIMKGIGSYEASPLMDISQNMWQDVVMTGGDYKNGVSSSEITVNLVDKKTNSLKQLSQYGQKLYAVQKQREEEMMKRYRTYPDSLATPPAKALPQTN